MANRSPLSPIPLRQQSEAGVYWLKSPFHQAVNKLLKSMGMPPVRTPVRINMSGTSSHGSAPCEYNHNPAKYSISSNTHENYKQDATCGYWADTRQKYGETCSSTTLTCDDVKVTPQSPQAHPIQHQLRA
eukprot:scaffold420938_cov24-Prasinocladus_malaysianus.AAC.1